LILIAVKVAPYLFEPLSKSFFQTIRWIGRGLVRFNKLGCEGVRLQMLKKAINVAQRRLRRLIVVHVPAFHLNSSARSCAHRANLRHVLAASAAM
jgi:hypothetical protein